MGKFADVPVRGFDGSSTEQAEGHFSDCKLEPVHCIPDPVRGANNVLVLCEVLNPDATPHHSNTRAALRAVAARCEEHEAWFAVEQEYTLYQKDWPLGRQYGPVPGLYRAIGNYLRRGL
ncbi:hypothetical protein A2477_04620 [Candidatus Falkowbacteria bacterium RIFOXYC2_FULL_47_12]|uniref:GS beta-grasp domain-containing protein n=2 Tax=Candidatus Falkowiibacteriota TaxID=1752728 RepID=A0A1F5TLK6_9BACT|nr:MAG: hypothetical protein A2242_02295 [Candidatus Falkowbacteria bacterium RIFOXYA2_FULL_47_9]OGF39813.1 MAG: hypothetical protein A2477_04620 [Candidatus Falkowbacteria bacterium RIFOXYC2_FULL_47_12]